MPALPGLTKTADRFNTGPVSEVSKFNNHADCLDEVKAYCEALSTAINQKRAPAAGCELLAFRLDDNYIGISWGRINGRQPTGFHGGGLPVFKIGVTGIQGFIYARATADLTSLQWTSASIELHESPKNNTTTDAFFLIGSYGKLADQTLVVQGTCGPVEIDICDLLPA